MESALELGLLERGVGCPIVKVSVTHTNRLWTVELVTAYPMFRAKVGTDGGQRRGDTEPEKDDEEHGAEWDGAT